MSPKRRKKHIIKNDDEEIKDEQVDEPPVPIFSSEGKEKVMSDDHLEDN